MSRVFYDHIVKFERLEIHIDSITSTHEEKHDLWEVIDKIIHNRIVNKILHLLPHRHHEEFANMIHERPFDKNIIKFLNDSSDQDIEEFLHKEMKALEKEILQELTEDE